MMTVEGELVDRIGVRLDPTRDNTAVLPVSSAVVHESEFLVSAMMLAADIASGIRLHEPGVATVLTTSFSFRRSVRPRVGPVAVVSTQLFSQGNRVMDRLEFRSDSGEPVGAGMISFVVRRPDEGPEVPIHEDHRGRYRTPWTQPIEQPLIEAAGIEISDAETGRVTMRSRDAVKRGGGILQGAFVTLMGEASALALAEQAFMTPVIVESLDVDFLAAVSADVLTTDARWLGQRGESDIEVVLRSDPVDSVVAVFLVGTQPATTRATTTERWTMP